MQLTIQVKLLPSSMETTLLNNTLREYISLVNDIVDYAYALGSMPKLSSKKVNAALPSALRDQCRIDAKSVYRRSSKLGCHCLLKKPMAIWNNQNYKVSDGAISFPMLQGGKSRRFRIKAIMTRTQMLALSNARLGTLRITQKSGKWIAQIAYEATEATVTPGKTMGVDLGLKCPAVATTSTGKVQFFGNGRQVKQKRRHFQTKRKKLGKAKKQKAIRNLGNKEQRWMRDCDHKLSHQIVNFAAANGCSVIKMEQLANIRKTARTSRKNNRSLHNWSFYRLASFIEYKANLLGIQVVYVDPAYTSQRCPNCGALNKAKDRNYECSCGLKMHRDIVGARNILCA